MNEIMNAKYRMYRRQRGVFYVFDRHTGKRESLQSADENEARRLLHARNEAHQQPLINRQIARAYLAVGDPQITRRTWADVTAEIIKLKTGVTQTRWQVASKDHAFQALRDLPIFATQAEHFLRALERGGVSTNVYLRRIHNFALDMGWLPWPILPKKRWPVVRFKEKRAITHAEHQAIVAGEANGERRAFYQLLWETGGSQSDIATLTCESVNRQERVLAYSRHKTGTMSRLHFGENVERLLDQLPQTGPLFPRLAKMHEKHRAQEFRERCIVVGIEGISLHSYRYAWAEPRGWPATRSGLPKKR
jgi:integrase